MSRFIHLSEDTIPIQTAPYIPGQGVRMLDAECQPPSESQPLPERPFEGISDPPAVKTPLEASPWIPGPHVVSSLPSQRSRRPHRHEREQALWEELARLHQMIQLVHQEWTIASSQQQQLGKQQAQTLLTQQTTLDQLTTSINEMKHERKNELKHSCPEVKDYQPQIDQLRQWLEELARRPPTQPEIPAEWRLEAREDRLRVYEVEGAVEALRVAVEAIQHPPVPLLRGPVVDREKWEELNHLVTEQSRLGRVIRREQEVQRQRQHRWEQWMVRVNLVWLVLWLGHWWWGSGNALDTWG